jgi:glycerol uptake facilitator-like aquaporin
VTIGLAIAGKFAWNQVAYYIVAQMIGAMLGASGFSIKITSLSPIMKEEN